MEQDNSCISWNSLPWKKFHRKSSSLQRKIYEARQCKNKKSVKRLQKLLLRSKSIYYLAVKKVTDYYSSRGIFLSQKIKSNVVNEVYLNLYKWKGLPGCINLRVNFVTLTCLKDEVIAYILNYLIKPVYGHLYEYPLHSNSTKHCVKFKNVFKLPFKGLFTISFLSNPYFSYLKSLVILPAKYKSTMFRSVTSTIPSFYLRSFSFNFRADLQSSYFSIISSQLKNLELFRSLDTVDSIQQSRLFCFNKASVYSIQRILTYENLLFFCKRFFRICGLKLNF